MAVLNIVISSNDEIEIYCEHTRRRVKNISGLNNNDSGGKREYFAAIGNKAYKVKEKKCVIILNNVAILSESTHSYTHRSTHAKRSKHTGLEVYLVFYSCDSFHF